MQHTNEPVASMTSARAVARYREEHVNNLGQQELLLMLYDGAIRFCGEARSAIEAADYDTSYQTLIRARDVVAELLSILNGDVDAEVVSNLRRLYDFCIYGITEVNFTKDLALLDGVVRVLSNLRAAWAELDFADAVRELTQDAQPPERNGNGNGNGATAASETTDSAENASNNGSGNGERPTTAESSSDTIAAGTGLSLTG